MENLQAKILVLPALLIIFTTSPLLLKAQYNGDSAPLRFSIPEIALIDIEPSEISDIHLELVAESEAGTNINFTGAENNDLWINYTSSLSYWSCQRSISVHIASGKMPRGMSLLLTALPYSGNGYGNFGVPAGTVNLTRMPQVLLSGIGRCYTGDGTANGHRLKYVLDISNFNNLEINRSPVIIIAFTLTDN